MDLKKDGDEVLSLIKKASWFPYKSGTLRNNATNGLLLNNTTYEITFDTTIAPYIEFLELGTKPHDIFNAFGKTVNADGSWNYWYPYGDGIALPFGIGGRFDGKFHPGSDKHKGFISDKSVNAIIQYFIEKYGGYVK